MVEKLNPTQKYYSQWGNTTKFEQPQHINQLSQPYALLAQKEAQLEQTYQLMNPGKPIPEKLIMVNPSILKGRQQRIGMANNDMKQRFSTQEASNMKQQVFSGLNQFSRFYSKEHVTPSTIASDIGATAFTDSSNYNPRGDSIMVDGDTPFITVRAEDHKPKEQALQDQKDQGMSITHYQFDRPTTPGDFLSLL